MRAFPVSLILVAALAACDPGPTSPTNWRDDNIALEQLCGQHTETQSHWGSDCGQPGPACLRDKYFLELFPEGLYVGCGELTINLLSSHAVAANLPSVGKARALYLSEVGAFDGKNDPLVGTALFGQAVALALNIEFSTVPEFAGAGDELLPLGDLVVADPDSPCTGMTTQQVLDEANAALGACDSVFPPEVIHSCVVAINKAFADGNRCSDLLAQADELR